MNQYFMDFYAHVSQYIQAELSQETNPPVKHISYDSRDIKENTLFLCKGRAFKRKYLLHAIEEGACSYIAEKDMGVNIPGIIVKDIRKALVLACEYYFDFPQNKLKAIAITGTKGKSTTCYLLFEILKNAFPNQVALISSIQNFDGKKAYPSHLTTPEPIELFQLLSQSVENNVKYLILEASSQAFKYERLYHIPFIQGGFLNLSEDHISPIEHENFEDYFQSKMKIFQQGQKNFLNLDTKYLDKILPLANKSPKLICLSQKKEANYQGHISKQLGHGFVLHVNDKDYLLSLLGNYNAENALMAIAMAKELQIDDKIIQDSLRDLQVPGRSQLLISKNKKIAILVDFAHNKLSFEAIFDLAKEIAPDSFKACVFGSVGDKAKNRREGLGQVAGKMADYVYLTSDNPGKEGLEAINKEIVPYLKGYVIIDNRQEAITKAFLDAENRKGKTLLLLLGRGTEIGESKGGTMVESPSDLHLAKKLLEEYDDKSWLD